MGGSLFLGLPPQADMVPGRVFVVQASSRPFGLLAARSLAGMPAHTFVFIGGSVVGLPGLPLA